MNVIAIIPARYNSTRFPGKPLIDIDGKTMIRRVYEQAIQSSKISKVIVATDDERIANECKTHNMNFLFTSSAHNNGTERCAEAINLLPETYDLVLNVQGDEPFIDPRVLDELIYIFEKNSEATLGTLVEKLHLKEELFNPSIIKVTFDINDKALYFSRQAIPFQRNHEEASWFEHYTYWKHIGIYAYKPNILKEIVQLTPSPMEFAESLEQLRWLENGYSIFVNQTTSNSKSVDTPEDLVYILNNINTYKT